jgi:Protein of unknown function (DUF4232)
MKSRWSTLAAGVVVAAAAGGALATASSSRGVGSCRTTSFTLAQGRDVPPPTGYQTLPLVFRNRSTTACVLYGYPAFAFINAQGALPFEFSHAGDQVVTNARPRRVLVGAGGSAFALMAKYRCDRGDRRRAGTVRIAFPGSGRLLTLRLHGGDISWCGFRDPGSTITVSPFERTRAATTRH